MVVYKGAYLISFLITVFITVLGFPLIASLSFGFLVFWMFRFISRLSFTIPFREVAMITASIQLLVSSFLAFYVQDPNPFFAPLGTPEDYFGYAIPGVFLFGLGLFTFKHQRISYQPVTDQLLFYDLSTIGKKLIGIGWIAFFLSPFVPGSLGYFVTLLVYLSYIGGICILFSTDNRINKWILIGIAYSPVVKDALFSGVFFLAVIWTAFFIIYYLYRSKNTFLRNFLIIVIGMYILIITDMSKKDYRAVIWDGDQSLNSVAKAGLFVSIFFDNASFNLINSEDNFSGRITRANQGAIVSWVMDYVPSKTPYVNGSTITAALEAAVLPRFLSPNKAIAGGVASYERFTGRTLNNTSINISLLGEGWANFGYMGGLAFMYFVGAFYSYIFKIMSRLIEVHPIYFFFIPYIFIFTIKAEDDLLTPLNHVIKSSLILFLLHRFYLSKLRYQNNIHFVEK